MQECIDADENARGMFYLVRTHDQDCLDDLGTEPPVEDFETSFEGKLNYICTRERRAARRR